MREMRDPSEGVAPALLPHVHLVSNFAYPAVTYMSSETIADYLLQAPTITRHTAPMCWTFLDAPPDGSLFLVWQPEQLGIAFASDGYLWADVEEALGLEVKGCMVEMYVHRCGYKPGKETVASHCRRRYRLASSTTGAPIDPSLWLVHYAPSEPTFRLPVNRIPIPPHVQQIMGRRQYLQSQGRLVRKEFMLHDRNNWPTVTLPALASPGAFPQHATNVAAGHRPQQPSLYSQPQAVQGSAGPSPAKRPRTMPYGQAATGPGQVPDADGVPVEMFDDEDTSLGDEFDYLTPRDVAMTRYKHNQEMMGEVLASPYGLEQIKAIEIGLEALLRTACNLPAVEEAPQSGAAAGTALTPANKKKAFLDRVRQRILDNQTETSILEEQHAKTVAGFTDHCEFWKQAEERVREAEWDRIDTGAEVLHVEGRAEPGETPENDQGLGEQLDDVVQEVEAASGKRVYITDEVVLVETGALDESHPALAQFRSRYHVGKRDWQQASAGVRSGMPPAVEAPSAAHVGDSTDGPSTEALLGPPAIDPAVPDGGLPLTSVTAQQPTLQGQSQASTNDVPPAVSNEDRNGAAITAVEAPLDIPGSAELLAVDEDMADAEAGDWVMVANEDEGHMPPPPLPPPVEAPTAGHQQASSSLNAQAEAEAQAAAAAADSVWPVPAMPLQGGLDPAVAAAAAAPEGSAPVLGVPGAQAVPSAGDVTSHAHQSQGREPSGSWGNAGTAPEEGATATATATAAAAAATPVGAAMGLEN